jgi:hypothetical protein
MTTTQGKWIPVDASRRLVLDVLHYSASVPCFPVEKWFHLAEVGRLRHQAATRISWTVLFAKAYGRVAAELPALRRFYCKWPWPRFYEAPHSVATIAMNRPHDGVDRLFWARLQSPESTSLVELQQQLHAFQSKPVEEIFHRHLLMARLPKPVRRLFWWLRLNAAVQKRARRMGTFGMSTLAREGVYNRLHPHFLTSSLSYGPLQSDGTLLATLLCDHRVLDGITAAKAINRLEEVLCGEIAVELRRLADPAAVVRRQCA